MDQIPSNELKVCFDGSCPLCRREVALYQKLAQGRLVAFVDVSTLPPSSDAEAAQAGVRAQSTPTAQELMARFHVQQANGEWLSGAAAFVAVWQRLPGWRWLAMLARLPGVLPVMEWSYRAFLRHLRPRLQAWVRRRESASADADALPK